MNCRCFIPPTLLTVVVATAGCDTIGQDVNHMMNSILPPSPGEAARMMTDQYDPDNRREGTVWIANAPFGGSSEYVELYRFMVETERDPTALASSLRALGRHGSQEHAPLIATRLEHENEHVRWAAATALQRLHNPAIIDQLLAVLRNDNERSETRAAAATALGQYPSDRVFQGLIRALDAPELSVNAAAEQSLTTLTGQSFSMDPVAWVTWYNNQPAATRFAGQREYLFPTYSRDETIFERYIMFWTSKNWEQPAPPAGLSARSGRTTSDFANDGE